MKVKEIAKLVDGEIVGAPVDETYEVKKAFASDLMSDVLRCVGACGLAPVMTINGKTYGRLVPEHVKEILAEYAD